MIPAVNTQQIENAIATFDKEYRHLLEWQGWELKRNQLYALTHKGALYPPKKIISLATGLSVDKFYGGRPSNTYLQERGFEVIRLSSVVAIPSFIKGKTYIRKKDITGKYGGSPQSGIAPSKQSPAIFVFTGEAGEQFGYQDQIDELGCLHYTGEGQVGDMTLTRGNLAIAQHTQDGRALHVFRSNGKSHDYEYLGEFAYVSHAIERGLDKNGNDRNIIVFLLMPVSHTLAIEMDLDTEEILDTPKLDMETNLSESRQAALAACTPQIGESKPKEAVRLAYQRSSVIKKYVLERAGNTCESCGNPAPFNRKSNGSPYLEPHHINRLSDGGLDHPKFIGAICPTCHRKIHYGMDGQELNEQLRETIIEKEEKLSSELL
jgi:5-methylcytosine-specific restriction protein A